MTDDYNTRLTVLEEKFEYQERTIDSLNEVIIDQQKQLTELELQLRYLKTVIDSGHDAGPTEEEPPPPHY